MTENGLSSLLTDWLSSDGWTKLWLTVDWLTDGLTDALTDWLTGGLGWLTGWADADWTDWLTGMTGMTDWLGWLTDGLTDLVTHPIHSHSSCVITEYVGEWMSGVSGLSRVSGVSERSVRSERVSEWVGGWVVGVWFSGWTTVNEQMSETHSSWKILLASLSALRIVLPTGQSILSDICICFTAFWWCS